MTSQVRQSKAFDSIDSIANLMDGDELRNVPCDLIDRDPDQPRQTWDTPEAIREYEATRDSIKSQGVRTPITVRPTRDGRFMLIYGENRHRACVELGIETIPSVVRENISIKQVRLDQLIENDRRNDLNPIDFARAIQSNLDGGLTRGELMEALGCKEQWLSKRLSVLRLPADVQEIARESLVRDVDTLAALSKLEEGERRLQIQALRDGHVGGEAVRKAASKKGRKKNKRTTDPNLKALVTRMQDKFGARVGFDYNAKTKRGSVTFKFNSLDEFEGLLKMWDVSLNDPAVD